MNSVAQATFLCPCVPSSTTSKRCKEVGKAKVYPHLDLSLPSEWSGEKSPIWILGWKAAGKNLEQRLFSKDGLSTVMSNDVIYLSAGTHCLIWKTLQIPSDRFGTFPFIYFFSQAGWAFLETNFWLLCASPQITEQPTWTGIMSQMCLHSLGGVKNLMINSSQKTN